MQHPPGTASIELRFRVRAAPVSVAEARRRVSALNDLPDRILRDVQLVVSELLTNALLHAGLDDDDLIDVALRREGEHVEVEVSHRIGLFGETGKPSRADAIGLRILDAICDHWHSHAGRAIATIPIQPWQHPGRAAGPNRVADRSRCSC